MKDLLPPVPWTLNIPQLICCPREVQDVEFELGRNCGGGGDVSYHTSPMRVHA
jgi:hypothetical protein